MKNMFNKFGILTIIIILAFGMCTGCSEKDDASKKISVVVVSQDKSEKEFTIKTKSQFLGQALIEDGLATDLINYQGFFAKTINGETVDTNSSQWWCFTTEGDRPIEKSVKQTPISDGDKFKITFMQGT